MATETKNTDTTEKTTAPAKPVPAAATAAALSVEVNEGITEQVKAILHGTLAPCQKFLHLLLSLVRPGGKVEAYVVWRKETGSDTPNETVKPIDDRFVAVAGGNTPENILESMILTTAKYYVRSGGVEKGRIGDPEKARVRSIVDQLLAPAGFKQRLLKAADHLIVAAKAADPQKASLVKVIARASDDTDAEPVWTVNASNRDERALRAFLKDLKSITPKRYITLKAKKDDPEQTAKEYLAALAAALKKESEESETETPKAVNQ